MVARRDILIGISGVAIGAAVAPLAWSRGMADRRGAALGAEIARIERGIGGRLGISLHDTQDGYRFAHRGRERFPMCSTFKFIVTAAILQRVDQRRERLDRRVPIRASDLLDHAPVTERHVGPQGMTVGELCKATVTYSDNPAANLLVAALGGLGPFNRFVASLGDRTTRIDRLEPDLNESRPGDPRDTTTPDAMRADMERLLAGRALSAGSRTILTGWLIANTTGDTRLRAGLPRDWRVGDKTGTGDNGSNNDIAILWPPARRPIFVTSYLTQTKTGVAGGAVHAAVARAIVAGLG